MYRWKKFPKPGRSPSYREVTATTQSEGYDETSLGPPDLIHSYIRLCQGCSTPNEMWEAFERL